jgi:hypothetical protein
MAISNMAFTPTTGLEDDTVYASDPATEATARENVQRGMNQLRDFINTNLVANANTKVRNLMGVKFSG